MTGMRLKFITSEYAFAGNPMVVTSDIDVTDQLRGGKIYIDYEGKPVFEGRFMSPLELDLSDIARTVVGDIPEPESNNTADAIVRLEDHANNSSNSTREFDIIVDYGEEQEKKKIKLMPGGVSKQNFRFFARSGCDAFDGRFLGVPVNFFLTTRSSDWRIEMKETELSPLYFLAKGPSMRVAIEDRLTGTFEYFELSPGLYALMPDNLRRLFLNKTGKLSNLFNIYIEDVYACQLAITAAGVVKERYRLKFRNSFGVFETMEITGAMSVTTSPEEDEPSYQVFDVVTRSFIRMRRRLEEQDVLTINTPLGVDRVEFMKDMLSSEEIYLLDASAAPVRVIVTSDKFAHAVFADSPEYVSLTLRPCEAEKFNMAEINSEWAAGKPKVHSDEFKETFN